MLFPWWALVFALACMNLGITARLSDDVETVRARILSELLWAPGSPLASAADAAAWASTLIDSNGTWPDITYDDPSDRTVWKAAAHTSRVQALAAAVAQPGHALYRSAGAFATARCALAGWLALDPQNTNWWWIILQSPQTLSASYLLLSTVGDVPSAAFPSAAELARGLVFMYRAAWWNESLGYEVTGANLAWMMQTQLTRGVLPTAVNESALAQGFARLWEEVRVVNDTNDGANQGIQVDEFAALWAGRNGHGPYILDCRERANAAELVSDHPDHWHNIPQGELRQRLDELPRGQGIVLVCNTGARSYESYVTLAHAGFTDVVSVEGGMTAILAAGVAV